MFGGYDGYGQQGEGIAQGFEGAIHGQTQGSLEGVQRADAGGMDGTPLSAMLAAIASKYAPGTSTSAGTIGTPLPQPAPAAPMYGLENYASLMSPGTLDLNDRPQLRHWTAPSAQDQGGWETSTVRSASFDLDPMMALSLGMPDAKSILLPTVVWNDPEDHSKGARLLDANEAWEQFLITGGHLGLFGSNEDADAYSQALHEQQAQRYHPTGDQ